MGYERVCMYGCGMVGCDGMWIGMVGLVVMLQCGIVWQDVV